MLAFSELVARPETPIFTNDIKKGAKVLLRNGWKADVWDNMKGQTRVCLVYGYETEAGSVYSHDIVAVEREGKWYQVTHTEKQIALRKQVFSFQG